MSLYKRLHEARFGLPAMPRKDKDFIPAFVLNQIVGGGVMSSRLWEEVREKRGLAYSVYTSVQPLKYASVFAGGVATKNEEIGQSLEVIRSELRRIATDGHAPDQYRADTVRNVDTWYEAFPVRAPQKLYLAPPDRVRIW